ncbi:MAG: hypothetical protein Q9195_004393 [Heterodermia aff. obscurata]
MGYWKKIAALAALIVPSIFAASLTDLPVCALRAASSGIETTGCGTTDYKCLCSANSFLTALQSEVMTECTSAEYQGKGLRPERASTSTDERFEATLSFAQGICASVGITLNLPSTDTMTTSPSTSTGAPAQWQATTAGTAVTPTASGAGSAGSPAASTASAPWSSYASSDAPAPSSAAVSTNSSPATGTHASASASTPSPLSLSAQSYVISLAKPTDVVEPSAQIPATASNGSSNTTFATSALVPFEGAAAVGHRLQWASVALLVGAAGAFAGL